MNPFAFIRRLYSRRGLKLGDGIMPLPPVRESFWPRLASTPMGDLLLGRLSASLDLRGVIASAGLPEPLAGLVYLNARRETLWSRGRVRAARKMIERFEDGLAAGQAPAALSEGFLAWQRASGSIRHAPPADIVDLPPVVAELVAHAVRRARLWPSERRDVSDELAAHFRDGLSEGVKADELVARFGSVPKSAKLIRRAKLRNRPLVYRSLRHTVLGTFLLTGAALVVYAFLLARFLISSPSVAHNYMADINARPRALPPDERSWPLYRAALMSLPKEQPNPADVAAGPKGEKWSQILEYLEQHRAALELRRQAATKPHLGFVFGDPDNRAFLARYANGPDAHGESPDGYRPGLLEITLPHAQELRRLATLFEVDAREAVAASEGPWFVTDVQSLTALAQHIRETLPCLVSEFIAFATYSRALEMTAVTLAEEGAVLGDENLKHLAHTLAGYAGGGDLRIRDVVVERMMIGDVLQRLFTDDAHGDGRLSADGFDLLWGSGQSVPTLGRQHWSNRLWRKLWGPVVALEIGSRRELSQLAGRWFDRWEAERAGPLWQWQASSVHLEMDEIEQSRLRSLHYLPVMLLMTPLDPAYLVPEVRTQERDAVLVAIALELHHRRAGEWPASLDELTPGLLPRVPPDRFTGDPLRYRLVEGRPLLYSCGTDRDDDGGVPPAGGNDMARMWEGKAKLDADTVATTWAAEHDGDWILWPPLAAPAE